MRQIIRKALTMILGLCALLGQSFSQLKRLMLVTSLWVILLPVASTFIGAASNQLVLIANHDKFPVMLNELKRAHYDEDRTGMIDHEHCVMTKDTHLNFLADILDFHDGIYSIGDLLLELGDWLWTFAPFVWGFEVVRRLRG